MITFIRHAEKDTDDFKSGITECGRHMAKLTKAPRGRTILTSTMPRAIETAKLLYPNHIIHQILMLNEFNKENEMISQFIYRVDRSLDFLKAYDEPVIVGHGKFMNVAYQLLTKNISIGFNYLESFTYET